jgi:hypothetical protein
MHKVLKRLVITLFLVGFSSHAQSVPVSAVEGESWLSHLHRSFNETSMGKTGRLGPPAPASGEEAARPPAALSVSFAPQAITLRGSDL